MINWYIFDQFVALVSVRNDHIVASLYAMVASWEFRGNAGVLQSLVKLSATWIVISLIHHGSCWFQTILITCWNV